MELIDERFIDWAKYLQAPADAANIRPASSYVDAVLDRLRGEQQQTGAKLPWHITHSKIRFMPGQVSVWAGINGHGKSMVQSHAVLGFIAQGERCCIASMEMQPAATMYRMTRQASGGRYPAEDWVRDFHLWTDRRLWLYDQQGTVSHDRMLALGRYIAQELGITHFIIDSLMKCGLGVDDYNGQKRFIDNLCALAKDTGMHIHLVAHARKGTSEHMVVDKFDVKGASEITDQVDNVLIVWRNKAKEEQPSGHITEPDALLNIAKQRHGEWEGKIGLWFDRPSMSYVEREGEAPRDYEMLCESLCR